MSEDLAEMQSIINELASRSCFVDYRYYGMCRFCSGTDENHDNIQHKDSCIWVRAKKLKSKSEITK